MQPSAGEPYQEQVESVEGRATYEHAEAERNRVASRSASFGSQSEEHPAQPARVVDHANGYAAPTRASVTDPAATARPSAVTLPSILYKPPIWPTTRA